MLLLVSGTPPQDCNKSLSSWEERSDSSLGAPESGALAGERLVGMTPNPNRAHVSALTG